MIAPAAGTETDVRWAIDLTTSGTALRLAVLAAAGQRGVYAPRPDGQPNEWRVSGRGRTDAHARAIAGTARTRGDLTELAAPDDLVVELTRQTARREDLMTDWVRGLNPLRALLTSVSPALQRAFDYSAGSALILGSGYGAREKIQAAGASGLIQTLLARSLRLVDVLWALLRDGRTFTPTAPQPATQAA